ncbi:hypothetical protein Mapa_014624 [Marchantia paleacea]|nr:hypothetical protein Mapa_014624 [Marchantia paleacea]
MHFMIETDPQKTRTRLVSSASGKDQVFGRTYAAYGGFFIILSLLWGWALDGDRPDKWDVTGAAIALAGVCVVMFMPRKEHVTVSLSPSPSV